MYGDNRDLSPEIKEKTKYYPHTESTVREFARRFPNKKLNIVDVGARDGYATELLVDMGYFVIGTEIISGFVDHAKKMLRPVVFDDILNTHLGAHSFDVIYSRHCIEHCRSTEGFLKSCEWLLRDGGHVFLTFPLETKDEFMARKQPGQNHMVYFKNKDAFREILKKTNIKEIEFCKSKRYGIRPDGREVLFVGRKDA